MSRAKGLFVTGTDTGVGKTRVTAVLAVALQQQGFRVGVMKPVETGLSKPSLGTPAPARGETDRGKPSPYEYGEDSRFLTPARGMTDRGKPSPYEYGEDSRFLTPARGMTDRGKPSPYEYAEDSRFLRQISGCTASPEIVTPYMFREPLAPAIAAEHEGQEIDLDHIVGCYEMLAAEYDVVLVEGAGGLLVPLTRRQNFLDLVARLDLPILVVARNILGTINHTTLTVMVASQRCRVSGIVLNTVTEEAQDVSQASNAEALRIWGGAPLLGVLSYMPEVTLEGLFKQSKNIDLSSILSSV